jgi:hypothetical protein
LAAGELDGLEGVDDDDARSAADGLAVAQHVVVVAGDEGVVTGHEVGGEVLDIGDLLAPLGYDGRVILVQALGLESVREKDLAQQGIDAGGVVVREHIGAAEGGVAEPEWPWDAADGRPLAEPGEVALVLIGRRPFLVDDERFGDPQADPAVAGEVDQLVIDLTHLQLRGPHDLRHSFSTWLEDEGIPARVIDELMGHQRSRRGELEGGSRVGARYRHTTPEMASRVVQALDTRLRLALYVAEATTRAEVHRSDRVF